jgi:hypothetical protein
LGTLGDPADLIVKETITVERRRGRFRGAFLIPAFPAFISAPRDWNNISHDGLM